MSGCILKNCCFFGNIGLSLSHKPQKHFLRNKPGLSNCKSSFIWKSKAILCIYACLVGCSPIPLFQGKVEMGRIFKAASFPIFAYFISCIERYLHNLRSHSMFRLHKDNNMIVSLTASTSVFETEVVNRIECRCLFSFHFYLVGFISFKQFRDLYLSTCPMIWPI